MADIEIKSQPSATPVISANPASPATQATQASEPVQQEPTPISQNSTPITSASLPSIDAQLAQTQAVNAQPIQQTQPVEKQSIKDFLRENKNIVIAIAAAIILTLYVSMTILGGQSSDSYQGMIKLVEQETASLQSGK